MTHTPVLLRPVLELLQPREGEWVLDVTLGLGGHSEAIAEAIGAGGRLVGLDADEKNIEVAKERLSACGNTVTSLHANFGELPECLPTDLRSFDIILADLGLSSPHLDDPKRGFSFREDGPLDMRFDQTKGTGAAMLLASLDRTTIRDMFETYGELPQAHRLTDAVIRRRSEAPVRSSTDLKEVAKKIYGFDALKYLPQMFQALRMAVNKEQESLQTLLEEAPKLLKDGGRFAVISYHSLEDRMVKKVFKTLTTPAKDPVTGADVSKANFVLLTKKAVIPSDEEIVKNPRSRSAKLRAIRKRLVYTSSRP